MDLSTNVNIYVFFYIKLFQIDLEPLNWQGFSGTTTHVTLL